MSKFVTSILSTVVHLDDRSPVFGEGIITVSIDDDGAGGYIVLTQDEQTIKVDPEELQIITKTAMKMLANYKKHEE